MKDKQYYLFQKINEDRKGYALQLEHSGCLVDSKNYKVNYLKEISLNRFICISNYGFKIYSLNKNNKYSLILLNEHL